MGREERLRLIQQIQSERRSRVVSYFCGDRKPIGAQISEDAIRPMYDHLRSLRFEQQPRRLDLILYSIGGAMETPWKIVSMLREFCDEYNAIVPFKAYSAATLIALGADEIWMTNKGELGPIDPAMTLRQAPGVPEKPAPVALGEVGVEDIAAYVSFIRNRAGLTDQSALAGVIRTLAETVGPTLLGRLERTYSHIRLVARKLLSLVKPPLDDPTVTAIVEALTEKTYAHGHGIGRKEARQLGLRVKELDGEVADRVWSLYLDYESSLQLDQSGDVSTLLTDTGPDTHSGGNYEVAYIESEARLHGFSGTLEVRRLRRIPQQMSINLNLGLQFPAGIQPQQIPQQAQQILQQMVQQTGQHIEQAVREELRRQAPVERIDASLRDPRWRILS